MRRCEHGGDIYSAEGVLLDFSVNINPLGLPDEVRAAVFADSEGFARYPDRYCRELRAALSAHHGIPAARILCGNGAADLIFRICACLKPKRAVTLAPTFLEYERSAVLFGAEIKEHRLSYDNGFELTEALLDELTADVDMLFLCNPNNPTGRLARRELLEETALRCRDNGITMVIDECFLPFTGGESLLPLLESCPKLLILRAFTKLYAMPGLRLGYLMGRAELIEEIGLFGAEWSVSSPAQAAGRAALSLEPQWSERTLRKVRAEREFLIGELCDAGVGVVPSDASFLLLKSEKPLCKELLKRGIAVRDCSSFSGLESGYIRVGIKDREQNVRLAEAIREIVNG